MYFDKPFIYFILQGNEAFGKGDFPTAVGHYTDAILADSSNPIYPLNRAAAYLKLGKYVFAHIPLCSYRVFGKVAHVNPCHRFEDAERDCSTVIRLDPQNAKAWYRRAQARQGLDVWDDALAGELHPSLNFARDLTPCTLSRFSACSHSRAYQRTCQTGHRSCSIPHQERQKTHSCAYRLLPFTLLLT